MPSSHWRRGVLEEVKAIACIFKLEPSHKRGKNTSAAGAYQKFIGKKN